MDFDRQETYGMKCHGTASLLSLMFRLGDLSLQHKRILEEAVLNCLYHCCHKRKIFKHTNSCHAVYNCYPSSRSRTPPVLPSQAAIYLLIGKNTQTPSISPKLAFLCHGIKDYTDSHLGLLQQHKFNQQKIFHWFRNSW